MRLSHLIGRDVVVHTVGPSLGGRLLACRRGVLELEAAHDLDAGGVQIGTTFVNERQVVHVQPVKAAV